MYQNILRNKSESLTNNYLNQLDINSLNALVTNSIIDAARRSIPKFKKSNNRTLPKEILKMIRERRELRKKMKDNTKNN